MQPLQGILNSGHICSVANTPHYCAVEKLLQAGLGSIAPSSAGLMLGGSSEGPECR